MINVFLLDDHEIVRAGLRALLESPTRPRGGRRGGDRGGGPLPASPPSTRRRHPRRPARRRQRGGCRLPGDPPAHPEIACIMLTSYADDEALFASIMAGAAGYVLKQVRRAATSSTTCERAAPASRCSTRR